MSRLALLLALVCTGCVTWDVGTTITPEWEGAHDADERELWSMAVHHATDAWAVALGEDCVFPFDFVEQGGTPVRLIDSADWTHGAEVTGHTTGDLIEIQGDSPFAQRGVLLHEFGHAMGLEHQRDPDSIMHPTVRYLQLPNTSDARRAREALGCTAIPTN